MTAHPTYSGCGLQPDRHETTFDPVGTNLTSELIVGIMEWCGANYLGGLEMGAVPIVACVAQKSFSEGNPIAGFFVRKERKEHGTRALIEGLPEDLDLMGKTVAIVDDVTTTGNSVLVAVNLAREAGADVKYVITIVDRQEGARENLAVHGLNLVALLNAEEFPISD